MPPNISLVEVMESSTLHRVTVRYTFRDISGTKEALADIVATIKDGYDLILDKTCTDDDNCVYVEYQKELEAP